MILNIVNGKPKVGTITVTTTAGATVTCVLSPYTLTATATSGTATFVVPKIGTWAITATKGIRSKSTTASITTYGGTASVTLRFEDYLFKDGTENVRWWYTSYVENDGSCISFDTAAAASTITWAYTYDMVDLTNYSLLTVQYTSRTTPNPSDYPVGRFGWTSYPTLSGQDYGVMTGFLGPKSSKTIATMDISSVTGSKYIQICNIYSNIKIYQVYLTY